MPDIINTGDPLKPPTLGLSKIKKFDLILLSNLGSVINPLDGFDSFEMGDIF